MNEMGRSRVLATWALAVVLVVTTAGPGAAAPCPERCACPMMAKMVRATPCPAGTGLAAPMDCCRPKAASPTPAPTVAAPASVELATTTVSGPVPPPPPPQAMAVSAARRANEHQLGLYTLHSIWRI